MHLRRSGIDRNKSESTRIQLISFDCAMWFWDVCFLDKKRTGKKRCNDFWRENCTKVVDGKLLFRPLFGHQMRAKSESIVSHFLWYMDREMVKANRTMWTNEQTKKKRMNFHQRLKIHWRNGRTRPRAGEMNKNIIQHYLFFFSLSLSIFLFHFYLFVFLFFSLAFHSHCATYIFFWRVRRL